MMKTQGRHATPQAWGFKTKLAALHRRRSPTTTQIASAANTETTTQRIFREIEEKAALSQASQASGAGGATRYADQQRLDSNWKDLRTRTVYGLAPEFVRHTNDMLPATPGLDVVVAGGTLGIFLASALQSTGLKVAVVERGPLKGRSQDWNISRKELNELVEAGAFAAEDAEGCVSIDFNPVRAAFHGFKEVWTENVLNLGVSPQKLIEAARRSFESRGGLVVEKCAIDEIWVHPNGVQLRLGGNKALAAKLLVDCMGHASPIQRQIRHGQKPDGVCLVVGSCARGFPAEKNTTGDVIVTASPSEKPNSSPSSSSSNSLSNLQLFWEAFPAGSGNPTDRTTYMFTYMDAAAERPSLEAMLDHYWTAMPEYQGVDLADLEIQRILFGSFPSYKDSPLPPAFDRIVAVGDASGMQSPLSFGGLGAMARHLGRLTDSISEAVAAKVFDKRGLKFINGHNPANSSAFMMQRAMSIPADLSTYDVAFINRMLGGNFASMAKLGEGTLKPFLQDVIQAGPLAKTLSAQIASDPLFVFSILGRVGVGPIADWLVHFLFMVAYGAAFRVAERIDLKEKAKALPPRQRYLIRRAIERWQFGSGLDYKP